MEEGIYPVWEPEEIYRVYYRKVYGYVISKIGNTQDAEDLAADVFVKVCEKLDRFDRSKASLSTWIYTITRNTLTDFYRTRRVFSEIPETQDDGTSFEEDICTEESLEILTKALHSLDERGRDIIILHFYEGRTLKEIAQSMGISYAYVRVLKNNALASLRKFFE